ncbi:reverse transcriptase domain-containing protein, partial [Tanacetum coccineum]
TLYPPTTSESSLDSSSERSLDSSSPSSRPSRKRCRSPTTLVSGEEHMEIGTANVEIVATLGIINGVRAPTEDGLGMGVEVSTSDFREDEEEFQTEASAGGTMEIVVDPLVTSGIFEPTGGDAPYLEGTLYDISHYMSERERAGLADRVRSLGRENLRVRALLCIQRDRIDSLHHHLALSQKEFWQVRRDRDDTRRRLRRTMTNTRSGMTPTVIEEMINQRVTEALGTREANRNIGLGNNNDEGGNRNGNGNINGVGNGNHNENDRDARPVVREYLMELIAEVYCPRTEIQKMESELWNLTVKNNDLAAYTKRFQELTMLYTKMVPEEEDRVEKFIGGLLDNI